MERFAGFLGVLIIARLSDWLPLDEPACPPAWAAALFAFPALLWGSRLLFPKRGGRGLFRPAAHVAGLALFLGSYYAVLYPLGWARWSLVDLRWRGDELMALLLLLAPAACLALWAAPWAFLIEWRIRDGRHMPSGVARRLATWARPLAAPAALLACAACLGSVCRSSAPVREALDLYRSLGVLLACGGLFALFAASPLLLRAAWPTRPFPAGALRDRFSEIACALHVPLPSVRIGEGRSSGILNACVLGLLPRTRHVIFTRAMYERLGPDDLAAVFAHEAGHAARRHLPWHFVLAAAFLLGIAPLDAAAEPLGEWAVGAVLVLYTVAYWRFFFGGVSRWLEMEADLTGARAVGPAAYAGGLRRIEGLLGSSAARGGWRHFSLKKRRELVEAASADPLQREAMLRRALGCRRAIAFVASVLLLAFGWCAVEELRRPEDILYIEKARLGVSRAADACALLVAGESSAPPPSWLARSEESLEEEIRGHLVRAEEHLARASAADAAGLRQEISRLQVEAATRSFSSRAQP